MGTFSELIKQKRIESGLSVRNLEQRIMETSGEHVSKTLISFLENEKRKPTYEVAIIIAKALGIEIEVALQAAFKARLDLDFQRERKNLEAVIRKTGVVDIDVDSITRQ